MIIREGLVCEEYEGYIYLIGISNPGSFCGNLRSLPNWRQPLAQGGKSVSSIIDTWADELTIRSENADTSEFEIEFVSSWYLLNPGKYKKACKKRIKIIKDREVLIQGSFYEQKRFGEFKITSIKNKSSEEICVENLLMGTMKIIRNTDAYNYCFYDGCLFYVNVNGDGINEWDFNSGNRAVIGYDRRKTVKEAMEELKVRLGVR